MDAWGLKRLPIIGLLTLTLDSSNITTTTGR